MKTTSIDYDVKNSFKESGDRLKDIASRYFILEEHIYSRLSMILLDEGRYDDIKIIADAVQILENNGLHILHPKIEDNYSLPLQIAKKASNLDEAKKLCELFGFDISDKPFYT